ncbi:hypothetical protein THAOC_32499 [Thalassiosira oceanica]|uniref:Uncharacterized protein n=1 Tax=Thalassiosira oceanica TaxID=159749 RepID=K0RIJ9_THAOC|nr:hypothetical protein THAOC_32499 [Thalassiosira oceanica]|eukprot:EJK48681.1 hypothetical protein THAOC_32499 [Thalassiosira oceanica]
MLDPEIKINSDPPIGGAGAGRFNKLNSPHQILSNLDGFHRASPKTKSRRMVAVCLADHPWQRSLRQLRQAQERHRQAQELHGLPPCQVLWRGLPEGPPQAAQEGLQATRGRVEGRAAIWSGAGEAGVYLVILRFHLLHGGGLLPDLHSAHSVANARSFSFHGVACCMKRICSGCSVAAKKRGMRDCAFSRTPMPDNDADKLAMVQARMAKKDPESINFLGEQYHYGTLGFQKDMRKAVELWTEAAELGSIGALYNLGLSYFQGEGVQQDKAKGAEFYMKAAMEGHAWSRYNLGNHEADKGNPDRAVRHWLISAKMGEVNSVENIKRAFMEGFATKEQYAEALKGYQDAAEEMKSHDRDEAKAYLDSRK